MLGLQATCLGQTADWGLWLAKSGPFGLCSDKIWPRSQGRTREARRPRQRGAPSGGRPRRRGLRGAEASKSGVKCKSGAAAAGRHRRRGLRDGGASNGGAAFNGGAPGNVDSRPRRPPTPAAGSASMAFPPKARACPAFPVASTAARRSRGAAGARKSAGGAGRRRARPTKARRHKGAQTPRRRAAGAVTMRSGRTARRGGDRQRLCSTAAATIRRSAETSPLMAESPCAPPPASSTIDRGRMEPELSCRRWRTKHSESTAPLE